MDRIRTISRICQLRRRPGLRGKLPRVQRNQFVWHGLICLNFHLRLGPGLTDIPNIKVIGQTVQLWEVGQMDGCTDATLLRVLAKIWKFSTILAIPANLWQSRQFLNFRELFRQFRQCRKPTMPAFTADIESAGIVEALSKMPGLSKIFIFWICMLASRSIKIWMLCFNQHSPEYIVIHF